MKNLNDDFGFEYFDSDEDESVESNETYSDEEDQFGFQPFDVYEDEEKPEDYTQKPSEQEIPEPEESFWQKVVSNPVTQTILGAVQGVTSPLDILKMFITGEGLTDLDELENAYENQGLPFDREDYIQKVFQLAEHIPTLGGAQKLTEEKTGLDLSPKDTFSKILRTGTEIATSGPLSLGKQAVKQGAKRLGTGIAAASAGEGAKELGVPEQAADIGSYILGGIANARKQPVKLTGKQAETKAFAEKHNLRKFGGLEAEEPLKNAIAPRPKITAAAEELSETSQKAIDKIIADKIPIAKQRAMGVDLRDAYSKAYAKSNQTAKALDAGKKSGAIDLDSLTVNIKDKIKKIQNSAPSLSPSDKTAIKELKKQYKALSDKNPTTDTYIGKKISAEQALDQYKNFNEEVEGIYRKADFTGSEEVIKNLYGELKSDLINSIEKSSPELAKELRFANKIYSETSKLDQITKMTKKAFEDGYNPTKLNQILGGKRNRQFIERDLGKDAVKEMQDIAKYGMDAEKYVLKVIKEPKTITQLASELTPAKAMLLLAKGSAAMVPILGYDIPKALAQRAKGTMMLSPKGRHSYSEFLKHSISPESAAFKKASRELTKTIEEEYGSEEKFIKFLEEED
jgi:hypothetical protein